MSNMNSARAAVAAELAEVKKGVAFYEARVVALEFALAQLLILIGDDGGTAAKSIAAKHARKNGKATTVKPTKGRRGRPPKAISNIPGTPTPVATKARKKSKSKGTEDLPSTGGTFWFDLVTDQPKSAVDVLNEACATLEFTPSPAQRQKLQQRMVFALNAMVKDGKIKNSDSGRARRFFK